MSAATVLASPSVSLWKALESAGVDAQRVFEQSGFEPSLLRTPGARVSVTIIRRLWLNAVEATRNPCIGLDFAQHLHPTGVPALSCAFYASATIKEAFERLARYFRVVNQTTRPQLDETDGGYCLRLSFPGGAPSLPYPHSDAILASALTMARTNAGDELSPLRLELMHPAPPCATRLAAFFRAPIEFDAPRYAMHFAREPLLRTLLTGNSETVLAAEKSLRDYLARMDRGDIAAQARKFIAERLTSGEPSASDAARALALSPRTLQRRLAAGGTSFARLLDETRRQLAQEYLRDPENTIEETAFLVGFAEAASFHRAFRRWTGEKPAAFRSAVRVGEVT